MSQVCTFYLNCRFYAQEQQLLPAYAADKKGQPYRSRESSSYVYAEPERNYQSAQDVESLLDLKRGPVRSRHRKKRTRRSKNKYRRHRHRRTRSKGPNYNSYITALYIKLVLESTAQIGISIQSDSETSPKMIRKKLERLSVNNILRIFPHICAAGFEK